MAAFVQAVLERGNGSVPVVAFFFTGQRFDEWRGIEYIFAWLAEDEEMLVCLVSPVEEAIEIIVVSALVFAWIWNGLVVVVGYCFVVQGTTLS